MTIEDDDDRPRRDYTELLPIGLALILTAAAIALCFLTFKISPEKPAAQPSEVTIGIGEGSTIRPPPPSDAAANPGARP
ncbi:MAG: hypothetical protein WDN08_03145 [Rhizomicrobium sp.]